MSSEAALPFGPIQMLVVSSEQTTFTGKVLPELQRLSDEGLVRLVDLLFVAKRDGEIEAVQATELSTEEAEEFGALVGALIGIGMAGEDGALAGAAAGAAEAEDGHVSLGGRGVVPRRRHPRRRLGRSGAARAPLGDPAPRCDHRRRRCRTRGRVDPPGRPGRGRRRTARALRDAGRS